MTIFRLLRARPLLVDSLRAICAAAALLSLPGFARTVSPMPETTLSQAPAAPRDGQHDFDFEIGEWNTHLRRLLHPLTGSRTWVEYEGTTVARKVWDGRAN